MVTVNLRSLFGRMDDLCRRALEGATGLTLSRSHYNVEIEHWLLKLIEAQESDVNIILKAYEIDFGRLTADLNRVLDKLKTGNTRAPALSPQIVTLAREAWVVASLDDNALRLRSGHLLCALLSDETLAPQAREASAQFGKISPEHLRQNLGRLVADGAEAESVPAAAAAGAAAGDRPVTSGGATPALDQYTIDLTQRARAAAIDPVLGRDGEIRQVIDILTRRRQNNPILTGEAGVGKTAVVEGFALRIAAGDVPTALQDVTLRTLDMGLLQAGAGVKGEFENRLKSVIDEVKASAKPIILFIDEAHTLIGAGGQAGQNDAANLLKPALARGDLRTIAATTWAEYKKYFERDAALARRFQVVKVEEPNEPDAVAMLRGLVPTLEKHHKVRILDEALVEAVRLSKRYIPGRQLPDKGVSLLDTACARVAMSQSAIPARIEDLRRSLTLIDAEMGILRREAAAGADHGAKLAELAARKSDNGVALAALEARWKEEIALVEEARGLLGDLEEAQAKEGDDAAVAGLRDKLKAAETKLAAIQGETPLVNFCVDAQAIGEVVAAWTGIPVGRMMSDQIRSVLTLQDRMGERIIGQPQALTEIAEAMRVSGAKLTDPRKPIGVFLMVGTSGVGKTETALTLAELLYGGEQSLTIINMSEFKEEHKVSMLVGSPPGYVGYGKGGVLTEAVRRRPYGVILLDEMEKAHPGVQDIFYQVFDKGMLRDGEGRDIDFKNSVIIMTSNAATDAISRLCADPETTPDADGLADAIRPDLLKIFKPAFLGRVTLVPYFPLSDVVIRQIVELQLNRIRARFVDNYKAKFAWEPAVVDSIASRCHEVESGARNVEHILNHHLLPEISARLLARMADGMPMTSVTVAVDPTAGFLYTVE
ncbi:MAG: type VI secretion system ATPase TssH [Stellaceae bacterium]